MGVSLLLLKNFEIFMIWLYAILPPKEKLASKNEILKYLKGSALISTIHFEMYGKNKMEWSMDEPIGDYESKVKW